MRRGDLWIWRRMNSLVLVHFPRGFSSVWSPPNVVNHGSFPADHTILRRVDVAGGACRLPVALGREAVRPSPSRFPFLLPAEEEPLLTLRTTNFYIYKIQIIYI